MDDLSRETKLVFNVFPVVETIPADLLTPLGVYLKLSAGTTNSFLLESVEGGKNLARYSFIGADPDFVITGNDTVTLVTTQTRREKLEVSLVAYVKEHFAKLISETDADLPAFIGGAIGYLGFGCSRLFEPSLTQHKEPENDSAFMFYRTIVAFDHAKQLIKIISLVFGDRDGQMDKTRLAAEEENQIIKARLETSETFIPLRGSGEPGDPPTSNWNRSDFENAVDQIKEMIRAGECYQVVLSQRFDKPTNASPVGIYRALRSLNPSPYMFLLHFEDKAIVGASPEMLVRCESGRLEYRPIAGTRPRGKTPEHDNALAEELKLDPKEAAEHLMLVDLGRNDLGRVAEYGSVSVDTLMNIEKYSHVQHLVSSLSARLCKGLDRFDALAACFPAGTVSGAPKIKAIEIIRDLEPDPRGVYAGAVGYFDYSGNMDTCIAIRTLVLENGIARIQAGAGIVADSVPKTEFDETVNKANVLLKAVEIAESGGV